MLFRLIIMALESEIYQNQKKLKQSDIGQTRFTKNWTAKDSELLRLIEVGASCFNHYCVGYDIRNHTPYTMSTGV